MDQQYYMLKKLLEVWKKRLMKQITEEKNKLVITKKIKLHLQLLLKKTKNPLSKKILINDENFLKIDSKEFNANSKNTDIEKEIRKTRKRMEIAAKELDFIVAAKFRDKIKNLKKILQSKT